MNTLAQALIAYAPTAAPVRTERSVELQLFSEITARLAKAVADTSAQRTRRLAEAMHKNRQLWHTIATSVASEANGLSDDLRARLFYLAEFTDHHSRSVLNGTGDTQVLVDINRAVIAGLAGDGVMS